MVKDVKIYLVGGAVRDQILGLEVKDRDYVVVGANTAHMLAQGFIEVGADFPVFLHPKTKEEYALARQERKVSKGYTGFQFQADENISLEEDLMRRDLTINAIAQDENGILIDPFNGLSDLKAGILRHVSPAFIEDPVRILRVARLAARYHFTVAPATMSLMKTMVANGEVEALVPERVWQELAKGLSERQPSIMFKILQECGALPIILPELAALIGIPENPKHHPEGEAFKHTLLALDYTAQQSMPLEVRYAVLCHDFGKALTDPQHWPSHINHESLGIAPVNALNFRLKVPNKYAELASLTTKEHLNIHRIQEMRVSSQIKLLMRIDAFRRPDRLRLLLQACLADKKGRLGLEDRAYLSKDYCEGLLAALKALNTKTLIDGCDQAQKIAEKIYTERIKLGLAYQATFNNIS